MRKKCIAVMSLLLGLSFCLDVHSAVVVTPTSLVLYENSSIAQYQVVLDSPPLAAESVVITPDGGDPTEVSVSPPILVFNISNWFIPQYMGVTPKLDGINDGDQGFFIANAVVSTIVGGNYEGQSAASVLVDVRNIDGLRTVVISSSSGIFLSEGETRDITFGVGPAINPTASVFVQLFNTAPDDIDGIPVVVILQQSNDFSATIPLTALRDELLEGQESFTVTVDNTQSADVGFDEISLPDIVGFVLDVDETIFRDGFES